MVVWVSGASSGLGLHTAQALQKSGMTVIAGARSFQGTEGEGEEGYRLFLDVTDPMSVEEFCRRAKEKFGPPDALCCCAGVLTLGACEEYSLSELREVMETNFLGQAAMVRRALPLMRAHGGGKIVLFSSINGLLGIPFQGAYVASKHAIEGYAECLRMEVKPYGISVCVVEPGDHKSGAKAYRRRAARMDSASPYYARYTAAVRKIAHDEANGSDPDALGARVAKTLQRKRMPLKLLQASLDQRFAVLLHRLLPARLFSKIISSYYK